MCLSVFTFVSLFSLFLPQSLSIQSRFLVMWHNHGVLECDAVQPTGASGLDFHCSVNESGRNQAHKISCSEEGSFTRNPDFLWSSLSSFPSFALIPTNQEWFRLDDLRISYLYQLCVF